MTGNSLRAAATALAIVLALAAAAGAQTVVRGFSLTERGDGLRLVLDTEGAAEFRLFALTDPWRIVADFPGTEWQVAPVAAASLPDGVAGLRFGLFRPGIGRLVMELEQPMRVRAAHAGERRFVLELAPASAAEVAATAGWPDDARWAPGEDIVPEIRGSGSIIVAIDPGHGGVDPGAVVEGAVEKEIMLRFARVLAARLVGTGRFRVFLTRERDIFVPLAERVRRARAAGANAILSIHADVVTEGMARGSSVYTLPDSAVDAAAERIALEHDRVDALLGADLAGESDLLTNILVELAQRGTQIESNRLAEALVEALRPVAGVLRTRPHRAVPFRVLKAPDTPSVLIELGYLSSAADRARLADPDWHVLAADAIVAALDRWAASARPDFLRPRVGQ